MLIFDAGEPGDAAYSYLQRNISLTFEHQRAGEGAVIVADQRPKR